jgi:molecular chaperone Hsp33
VNKNIILDQDLVQLFQLESGSFRGRLVRLGPALDIILHQHAYPHSVGGLLAEAMVIAAALGTSLKYEGVFTLQAKGDGAVRMLVADVTSDGGIRGYAQFVGEQLGTDPDQQVKNTKLIGKGYLAFTVDQQRKDDRYQGLVEMQGNNLAEAVQHYFRQSEQLPTGIMAAVRRDDHGRWHGGCLMLQQMPRSGGIEGGIARGIAHDVDTAVEDDWYRCMMLMGTCTENELTDPTLEPNALLYRLFHEEGVRVFDPHLFRHQCRCSEERVKGMLKSLPRAEIEELAINGVVDVVCEFCNKSYKFNKAQREELYVES